MSIRTPSSWQLILADLSLILFLIALAGLAGMHQTERNDPQTRPQEAHAPQLAIAPSQALYRPSASGPSLDHWLAEQPRDHRATLTIFASYRADDRSEIWREAEELARAAETSGVATRIVLTPATRPDLYASLAFDSEL